MSGKFIVFEGIDNSGKTTVSKAVAEWLRDEYGITTVATRHPGSTPVGQEIRTLLKTSPHPINPNAQALLFAADNSMFMHQILEPALAEGNWVIGDRNNFISSLAYQIASGCSWDELDMVHAATKQIAKIDLLLVFRCPWEESQRRRTLKGEAGPDRYEDAGREYFEKLLSCYDQLFETQEGRLSKFVETGRGSSLNCRYVDASKSLEEVVSTVKSLIRNNLLND
jgi:dTMP kinase